MNAKNTLGARLGKKFINLEPDSVRPFFPNTLYNIPDFQTQFHSKVKPSEK